jgi:hypothetical protein
VASKDQTERKTQEELIFDWDYKRKKDSFGLVGYSVLRTILDLIIATLGSLRLELQSV